VARWRVLLVLVLAVGLASVLPSGVIGPTVCDVIRRHDGIAHSSAYFGLALVACWVLWPLLCEEPDWRPGYIQPGRLARGLFRQLTVALGVILAFALVGALVEVLQQILPTDRTLSGADMAANAAGAAMGTVVWIVVGRLSRKKR
jgi:hypothetical protein